MIVFIGCWFLFVQETFLFCLLLFLIFNHFLVQTYIFEKQQKQIKKIREIYYFCDFIMDFIWACLGFINL